MILRFSSFGAWPLLVILSAAAATAQIDRRPELKTRPVAWTEFDGSYLVDPNSRADMLDFYWTVLARPYPEVNWTGSLNPQVAGTTSELWRVREYAQLNAYRAMVLLPPVIEDPMLLSSQQEGALVLAVNNRGLSHIIDPSWIGYNEAARVTLQNSNLTNYQFSTTPFTGAVDNFIYDGGDNNLATVGHRMNLLHFTSTTAALGASRNPVSRPPDFVTLSVQPFNRTSGTSNASDFVAWPPPGFFPLGLLRPRPDSGSIRMRWSFNPAVSILESDFTGALVTATIAEKPVAIQGLRYVRAWPITWEFSDDDLDPATLKSDTGVQITVSNAVVRGQLVTFTYTVTLFDETTIKDVGFAPRTPLMNISTRGEVGAGDRAMIAGFIVDGALPVRVALRSQGPSLGRFGIQNTTRSTRLTLHDNTGNKLYENTSWKAHPNWRLLASTGVAPMQDNEAGMVVTLWPGSYTAILSDDADANGVGIVEAFNVDNLTSARLMNLSTRGVVSSGDRAMIAGFIIKNTPRTVVLRTQGPSLSRFGIPDPVADTMLRVVGSDGATIATNDDWRQAAENARLGSDLVPFAPLNDREAALVLTLQPGAYTAIVEAKGPPGIGIVELFDVL